MEKGTLITLGRSHDPSDESISLAIRTAGTFKEYLSVAGTHRHFRKGGDVNGEVWAAPTHRPLRHR